MADGLGNGLNADCFFERQETEAVDHSSHFELYQESYVFALGGFTVVT